MATKVRTVGRAVKQQAVVLGGTVSAVWAAYAASILTDGALIAWGIVPRTFEGLRGIVFAPFLHATPEHLLANTLPLLVLGWLVLLRNARHFVPVTLCAMLGAGLFAWLFGAPNSVHIGASGVVFGYFGFLMLAGWFARSPGAIILSILVTVGWGGLVLGVVPGQPGISWQAHLGGFIGGILAARWLAPRRVPRLPARTLSPTRASR
jgi:membrane associated rhomboid family serine protease